MAKLVWLTEERTYAFLLRMGAHYSLVEYTHGGHHFEVLVDNDEIDFGDDDDED